MEDFYNKKKNRKISYEKTNKKNEYKRRYKSREKIVDIKKLNIYKSVKLELFFKKHGIEKDKEQRKNKLKTITLSNKKFNEKDEIVEYLEAGDLGHGAFGTCYIYESTKDWIQYAAKIVSKEKLQGKNQQSIVTEIDIQKSLNSPKVVKVKSYSEDGKNVYIILELCKNRSLHDLLKKRGYLTEFEVRNYMFQLIQGVKYLHNKMIIHRDLKPNNIFLDEKLELKIGDFGLITKLSKEKERKKTYCGTLYFMAPEVIDPGEKGYSFEVDIWSIGVIMYNLLTGKYPFFDKSQDNIKIKNKILEVEYTFPDGNDPTIPKLSEIAKDLIRQILVKDRKKRPGLNQILYHDFFHVGAFPRFLELSTLVKQPNSNEDENFNKEPKMKDLYKLIVNDIPEIKYDDLSKYSINYITPDINKIDYWISFFHVSSGGFCYYETNNGMIGIMWKKNEDDENYEGAKYLLNQKNEVFYEIIEGYDEDTIKTHNINKYPKNLKEKMEIFFKYNNKIKQKRFDYENQSNNFTNENDTLVSKTEKEESYSKSESSIINQTIENKEESTTEVSVLSEKSYIHSISNSSNQTENKEEKENIIYIKSFYNDKNGKFLTLSDDTKQIIFKDKIHILISDKKESVGYIDRHKKVSFIPLLNAMKNSSKDLISRLKYIKQVNYRVIKAKMQKKIEESKNQYQNNENNEKEEEQNYDDNNY